MTLTLLVPANLQIGAVNVTAARQLVVQRRLQMAIQRHLFGGQHSADASQKHLDEVIESYRTRLAELKITGKLKKQANDYWNRLNTPEPEPQGEPGSRKGTDPEDEDPILIDPEPERGATIGNKKNGDSAKAGPDYNGGQGDRGPKAALFCLTFQGLSGAFAAERLGAAGTEADSDVSSEAWDADSPFVEALGGLERTLAEARAVSPELDSRREVLYSTALQAVAELLSSRSWQALQQVTADPAERNEIRDLVATVLLGVLVEVLGDWFEIVQERKGAPRRIVLNDPGLMKKLDRLLAEMPFAFSPQPLREAVRYDLNDGPNDYEGEGFQVDLIGYRRSNAFIANFHKGATAPANRSPRFATYVEAVNAQMAVAWRINRPLYEIVRTLISAIAPKSKRDVASTETLSRVDMPKSEMKQLCDWVRSKLFRPKGQRARGAYNLAGEFLDHDQAKAVLDELVGKAAEGPDTCFYLCWKADFRGRIYAHTSWLTPQGSDVQRALFEFATGRKLDETGVQALRRHGANLVSTDCILDELDVKGRRVATLEEREAWVLANEDKILASAANPLQEPFWREEHIKKPIQFLGFCLAYAQWKADPEREIHLPVQIDGTCNGLQHIAALCGDKDLAQAVNVLPRPGGLPSDIYTELAKEAALVNPGSLEFGNNQAALRFGNSWLARQGSIEAFLDRDTAKSVIMTIPYGATHTTQAAAVLKRIEKKLLDAWARDPDPQGLTGLVARVNKSDDRKLYVKRCTEGYFEDLEKEAVALSHQGDKRASEQLWRLQVLAAYVSWTLVARLRKALEVRFPLVGAFSEWLNGKVSAASGLPLMWLSPLGFPVCQNKFDLTKGSISARLGKKSERLDVRRLAMSVSRSGQRNGLMPNLIHSLDSTHLAMVIIAAKARGIFDLGTIHDCIQCHPNDAETLAGIVREQFAQLYAAAPSGAPALRETWEDWIDLQARMRLPKQALNLLAVMKAPEGIKAELLRKTASKDNEAALALELLPDLQALGPPEAYLARQVLDYAGKHYVKPKRKEKATDGASGSSESEEGTDVTPPRGTEGDPGTTPKDGNGDEELYFVGASAADLGMRPALSLDGGRAMSPFFFS